jgi:hypothetical protein
MKPLLIAIEPGPTHVLRRGFDGPTLQHGVGHWTEAVERFGAAWPGETLLVGNAAPGNLIGIDRFRSTDGVLEDEERPLWLKARSRFVRLLDPLLAGAIGSGLVQDEWDGTINASLASLLVEEVRSHKDVTIFIPTAIPVTAETVIRNVAALQEASGSSGRLRLRIRFSSQGHERRGLDPRYFALQLKRWSERAGAIDLQFGTEVESMAQRYSEASGLDVAWVPWPSEVTNCAPNVPGRDRAGAPHVYIYASRPEQGSAQSEAIALSLRKLHIDGLRTTIQIGTKGRSDAAQMIKRIEAMGNITLSKSGLHPAELHAQFADAAAIVLPYDVRRYKGRGSALMWGALDHGIPLIAPAGTGFGDDIARHGIGVTYKHQREIAALVQQILEAPQEFTDAITRYQAHRAVAVRKFFNE